MEIIIGLVVLAVVGYFVFFRKPAEAVVEAAPYKVDVAPTPIAEQASEAVVKSVAKKAPAKKTTAVKKPAVIKAVAKKPAVKKVAVKKTAKKVVKAK